MVISFIIQKNKSGRADKANLKLFLVGRIKKICLNYYSRNMHYNASIFCIMVQYIGFNLNEDKNYSNAAAIGYY